MLDINLGPQAIAEVKKYATRQSYFKGRWGKHQVIGESECTESQHYVSVSSSYNGRGVK